MHNSSSDKHYEKNTYQTMVVQHADSNQLIQKISHMKSRNMNDITEVNDMKLFSNPAESLKETGTAKKKSMFR